MKRNVMTLILAVIVGALSFTAEAVRPIRPIEKVDCAIPLRAIVLYPKSRDIAPLMAGLILEQGRHFVLYEGVRYDILPVNSNSRFDSMVEIKGEKYFFRLRPRPHE